MASINHTSTELLQYVTFYLLNLLARQIEALPLSQIGLHAAMRIDNPEDTALAIQGAPGALC